MFRPLGALQQERAAQLGVSQDERRLASTGAGSNYDANHSVLSPHFASRATVLSPQQAALPFSGRYAGRNRRLKGRQPPSFGLAATQLDLPPPPLPRDAVLPININFNLHDAAVEPPGGHPRRSYDPSGDAWVLLTTAPNEIMATLLRSQLADAGIPALVKMGAAVDNGEFINNAWVMRSVWVQAREVERAREVLNFYHGDGPLNAEMDEDDEEYGGADDERGRTANRWRESERSPKYELPWLPTEHYEDRDMVAANASVDEQGHSRYAGQDRSLMQRPWLRWFSFLLLLVWVLPYLLELLGQIGKNLAGIFGGR